MTETTAVRQPPAVPRSAWNALIVLMAGMFMALLDTTIVNVALPTIRLSLDASEATLSWIISGYALAFGIALIPAGRIGDRVGHKWVFFTGLLLFTVASAFCGLAQNSLQLIVARAVQGLAGGIFVPGVTAMIQLLFPPQVRGKAFAIMGSVIGVSTALGPILGGLIIEAFGDENGWRLVFWVNLPIGVIALIAAAKILPAGAEGKQKAGYDFVGLALVTAGLIALLVPLIEGQDKGWPAWTFVTLAVGRAADRGVRALGEAHRGRQPDGAAAPVLAPGVHRRDDPRARLLRGVHVSIFFTISLLWQAGLGHTALESGLVGGAVRDRVDHRGVAEQPAVAAAGADRARRRHRHGRGRPGLRCGWCCGYVPAADLTHWELLAAPAHRRASAAGCSSRRTRSSSSRPSTAPRRVPPAG